MNFFINMDFNKFYETLENINNTSIKQSHTNFYEKKIYFFQNLKVESYNVYIWYVINKKILS